MSDLYRANRKVTDKQIIELNKLGMSLKGIAETLNCHPSTIKQRLDACGVQAADTRRSFMNDVYAKLPPQAREWLSDRLNGTESVKDLITQLICDASIDSQRSEG